MKLMQRMHMLLGIASANGYEFSQAECGAMALAIAQQRS
jgi:hypothetical protein